MNIVLQPRLNPSKWLGIAATIAAFVVALLIGGVIVAILGRSPVAAFQVYFVDPLTQDWSLEALAVKASPLIMIAVGLSFCFRANLWNIGAEGQFIAGGALGAPWRSPRMVAPTRGASAAAGSCPACWRSARSVAQSTPWCQPSSW